MQILREPAVVDVNHVSGQVVDAAIRVHSELGPGLLESAYEACLLWELRRRGFNVANQVLLPIQYGRIQVDAGYRIDLLVEDSVIVELKAIETVHPIHQAQLLSYLKLSKKKLGLLINFHVPLLKHGIVRLVNEL